jgi:hypothetical protein
MKKFNSLKHAWVSLCREPVNVEPFAWSHLTQTSDLPAQHSSSSSAASSSLGVCALQKLGVISLEQDRVKAQFVTEVCRALESTVRLTASKLSKWPDTHHCGPTSSITQIVDSCRKQSVSKPPYPPTLSTPIAIAICLFAFEEPLTLSALRPVSHSFNLIA